MTTIPFAEVGRRLNEPHEQGKLIVGQSTAAYHRDCKDEYGRVYDWYDERTTWVSRVPLLTIPYNGLGVYTWASGHSTGKTVNLKRFYAQIGELHPERSGFIIDAQGMDHRDARYPSRHGRMASIVGERRWGYGNRLRSITPRHLYKPIYYTDEDEMSAISFQDLDFEDWRYVMTQAGDSVWVPQATRLIHEHFSKGFALTGLIQAFKEAVDEGKEYEGPLKSLSAIARARTYEILLSLESSGALCENSNPIRLDIIKEMSTPGRLLVLNLHSDDSLYTMLAVGVVMRQLHDHYMMESARERKYAKDEGRRARLIAPFVVIEEANLLIGSTGTSFETPGDFWIRRLINQAQKAGFLIVLVMQDMQNIQRKTRRSLFSGTVFTCDPTGDDTEQIALQTNRTVVKVIRDLDLSRDVHGTREWAMIDRKRAFPFRPFAAPIEFFDRFNMQWR